MPEEKTEQAAVDATEGQATPAPEGQDARETDDLDVLLKEYETTSGTPKPEPTPEPKADTADQNKAALEIARQALAEVQQERFVKDMTATVAEVRGNLPAEFFDDAIVKAWIEARATEDPRLGQAWANRAANPKQFEKVKVALSREFAVKYGKLPDKSATEDREAVSAAVRGASTKAPEGKPLDMSRMTDGEFEAAKRAMFR